MRKETEYRLAEFNRRQRIKIEEFETWIVFKEDLILSKLFWAKDSHSELQLRDVTNLVSTGFDAAYLRRWTGELGLGNLLARVSRMTDTPAEIERLVRDKIMARSAEERFVMGAQMFESAREMILASLPRGLSEAEQRRRLFKRFYGEELNRE